MKRITAFMFALIVALCGCTAAPEQSADLFYYLRTEQENSVDILAPEPRDLTAVRDDPAALAELYCAGPIADGLRDPLPADARLLSCTLEDGTLTLAFSRELAQFSGIELTLTAACMTHSLLPLTDASELVITAEGALLNGEAALRMTPEDLVFLDNSMEQLHQDFTLYYASPDRRYLIGQEVSVQVSAPEEVPMQLLELLLTPPSGTALRSALPDGTRFHSVTVEDGLCTVSVSPELENRRFYNMSAQCLTLLSVVNTLTALEGIERVEFQVDGNLLIRYGSLSIDQPLVRDERCIGPVRTALGEVDAVLYLLHGEEDLLVPIPARLRQSSAVPLAEQVVRAIMQDPGINGIRSRIPAETTLNRVTVENGICYVDVSEQYLSDATALRSAGRVLAASLCALEGIEGVQILINGAVPAEYDSSWFGILTPNDDWFL